MAAGEVEAPGGRNEPNTHADATRQAVAALLLARQAGDERAARRHLTRMRRSLDAHIEGIRAGRSLS